MALVVMPTMKSMRAELPHGGNADTGRTGALDPRSLYGATSSRMAAMVVIAIIRAGKLRRLGDAPGDPKASGIPLLFANASLAVVVLLLSGVGGAIAA